MYLSELNIRNFRCIEDMQVQPLPGINIITGDNASGKTSVLESIYLLGRGQTFRRTGTDALIRKGQTEFTVFGRAVNERLGGTRAIGIRRRRHETLWKIDGRSDVSLLELVKTLPIQVIDPDLHRLLEEGPAHRRRFLDWGVFHVEHDFYPAWRRLRRILRQRNRALKSNASVTMIRSWDEDLSLCAQRIDEVRRRYLQELTAIVSEFMQAVLPGSAIRIQYSPGWPRDKSYKSILDTTLGRDRELGHTQAGPHRADLRITIDGDSIRQRASRGQQKLIAMVLLMAQAEQMRRRHGEAPIVLIDDLAAELGLDYRGALLRLISSLQCQCFITFLDAADLPAGTSYSKMFHVEHGAEK